MAASEAGLKLGPALMAEETSGLPSTGKFGDHRACWYITLCWRRLNSKRRPLVNEKVLQACRQRLPASWWVAICSMHRRSTGKTVVAIRTRWLSQRLSAFHDLTRM